MLGMGRMTGRQRFFACGLLALMGAVLLYSVFGEDGLIDYYRLRDRHRDLAAANEETGHQNLELYRVIERLSGDLDYIETMARREMGMVAPEEFIFKFEASRVHPRVVPDTGTPGGKPDPAP